MRYNDEQLFEFSNLVLNRLKKDLRFNEFCVWAVERLNYLIEESTNQKMWMSTEVSHLRNYRLKAVRFYEQKEGNNMSLSIEDWEEFAQDSKIVSIKPSGVESIQNEREDDYGDAKTSHESIAIFWNEYLRRKGDFEVEIELDATDVAVMLSLMKVSRLAYKRKLDSLLDFASYADFAFKFEKGE